MDEKNNLKPSDSDEKERLEELLTFREELRTTSENSNGELPYIGDISSIWDINSLKSLNEKTSDAKEQEVKKQYKSSDAKEREVE